MMHGKWTPGQDGAVGINALERTRREYVARNGTDALIDLTNSRFDRAELAVPEMVYAAAWRAWRERPTYTPSGRGGAAARTAVAAFLSGRYPGVGADDVVITAGSSISYHLLFTHLRDAAAASGSGLKAPPLVALPLPGYPLFEDLLRDAGLEPCWYHCLPEQQFVPDPAEIEGLLSGQGGTRGPLVAVVVISPNNPSGVVLSPGTEATIAAACSRNGAMLIVDEVFAPFVSTEAPDRAPGLALGLAPTTGTPGPVVRLNGLSKMAAAPEVKVGWVAVTGGDAGVRRALVDDLDTRHDTYLTVSGFAEACTTVFLADSAGVPSSPEGTPPPLGTPQPPDRGGAWLETVQDTVNRQRAVFDQYLTEIPSLEDVRRTVQRGGIHRILRIDPTVAAMRFGTLDDETIAIRILTETGVLLHPGYLYGMDAAEFGSGPWLVVSSLNTGDVLASAVRRLHRILR